MAIQLCPVDTANVHPRNILGSSSSFDRERLSRSVHSVVGAGKLWSTSPSAPGRPSLVANPARKGTLSMALSNTRARFAAGDHIGLEEEDLRFARETGDLSSRF